MLEAARILQEAATEIDKLSAGLLEEMNNNENTLSNALKSGSVNEVVNIIGSYEPKAIKICGETGVVLQKAEEILRSINQIKLALSKE